MSGEDTASTEADLDSLMDKYDDKEKKDKDAKDLKDKNCIIIFLKKLNKN